MLLQLEHLLRLFHQSTRRSWAQFGGQKAMMFISKPNGQPEVSGRWIFRHDGWGGKGFGIWVSFAPLVSGKCGNARSRSGSGYRFAWHQWQRDQIRGAATSVWVSEEQEECKETLNGWFRPCKALGLFLSYCLSILIAVDYIQVEV